VLQQLEQHKINGKVHRCDDIEFVLLDEQEDRMAHDLYIEFSRLLSKGNEVWISNLAKRVSDFELSHLRWKKRISDIILPSNITPIGSLTGSIKKIQDAADGLILLLTNQTYANMFALSLTDSIKNNLLRVCEKGALESVESAITELEILISKNDIPLWRQVQGLRRFKIELERKMHSPIIVKKSISLLSLTSFIMLCEDRSVKAIELIVRTEARLARIENEQCQQINLGFKKFVESYRAVLVERWRKSQISLGRVFDSSIRRVMDAINQQVGKSNMHARFREKDDHLYEHSIRMGYMDCETSWLSNPKLAAKYSEFINKSVAEMDMNLVNLLSWNFAVSKQIGKLIKLRVQNIPEENVEIGVKYVLVELLKSASKDMKGFVVELLSRPSDPSILLKCCSIFQESQAELFALAVQSTRGSMPVDDAMFESCLNQHCVETSEDLFCKLASTCNRNILEALQQSHVFPIADAKDIQILLSFKSVSNCIPREIHLKEEAAVPGYEAFVTRMRSCNFQESKEPHTWNSSVSLLNEKRRASRHCDKIVSRPAYN